MCWYLRKNRLDTTSGFVLIEAVLSVVIVAVSLTFILQSMTATYRAAALNVDYTKALILLENQMSLIAKNGFIEAGLRQDEECAKPFDRFHSLLETSASSDVKDGINDVQLEINFKSGLKNNRVSLITYLFQPPDEKK